MSDRGPADANVADGVEPRGRVDDATVGKDNIVGLREQGSRHQEQEQA